MADETSQQLAALLRDGQAHLDRGEFARAESLFAEALALFDAKNVVRLVNPDFDPQWLGRVVAEMHPTH